MPDSLVMQAFTTTIYSSASTSLMKGSTSAFKPDPRYPITKLLSLALKGLKAGKGTRGKNSNGEATGDRYEVVSESLCDDIISYLAPTLEQHKGCTLIDVHPGSCLWSSKLHDFLKPKRHLLMEPDERYFEPFIKPLLEQPGSTYRWTRLPGAHPLRYWSNYETVMNDKNLIPAIPTYPVGDPRRRSLNKDVLLIGNLARQYPTPKNPTMDYPVLVLLQMVRAALSNAIFHQGGPVRMLWWLSEERKSTIFPSDDISIQGVNATFNLGANINEVAGTLSTVEMYDAAKRWHRIPLNIIDAISQNRIANSAMELGISRPESRQWLNQQDSVPPMPAGAPLVPLEDGLAGLQKKLRQDRHRLVQIRELLPGHRKKEWQMPKQIEQTIEYPHCVRICEHVKPDPKPSRKRDKVAGAIVDMHLRITKLEATLKELEETCAEVDKPKLATLEAGIREMNAELINFVEDILNSNQLSEQITRALDFTTAFSLNPPLLANYARSYEPLKVEHHEIWPQTDKGLMLLDFMPKSHDLSVPDLATNAEGTKTAQMLVKLLYNSRKESLGTQLDKIALNAAQDLVPEVPAITDARKGGRLDPRHVRVRMLTPEMIVGLAKAWIEWPFKPSAPNLEFAAEGIEESGNGSAVDEELEEIE